MSEKKVVKIDFFTEETLPPRLKEMAKEQGVKLDSGLVVVKTRCCPPSYDFESIGTSPGEIQALMKRLAKEDCANLDEIVKKMGREK